jgi:hypothetical protein
MIILFKSSTADIISQSRRQHLAFLLPSVLKSCSDCLPTVGVSGLSAPERISHYMLLNVALILNRNGRDCRTSSSTRRLCILSGQKGTPKVAARALVRVLTDHLL